MDPLDIARWQFGITTVYHFLTVPMTLGLGPALVLFQTMWLRGGNPRYLRLVKFWGKVYLINFILGVATGIVQEFQFGMAWSDYSRFVGDVFGAPLAMEGLLAFFFESTFLGLWIFGWDRLPRRIHLAALWLAVGGSIVSAFFIIVANSWMQHPVGVVLKHGRPELVDIWAVLTNNTAIAAYTHTLFGAAGVAGGLLIGIGWYQLWRRRHDGIDDIGASGRVAVGTASREPWRDVEDHRVWLFSLRLGAVVAVLGFAGVTVTGDLQAKLMFEQQPMKMAAAEAACKTGTAFSVLSIGDVGSQNCDRVVGVVEIPGLLSFLATGNTTTTVKGVDDLVPEYVQKFGASASVSGPDGHVRAETVHYVPLMEVTYWGFRIMIGFGGVAALAAAVALWLTRKGTVPSSRWIMRLAVLGIFAPFGANAAGWIFTEMGRQPFVVAPNPTPGGVDGVFMFTQAAVSPGVSAGEMLFSLIALGAVYSVLIVVEIWLIVGVARRGLPAAMPELARRPDEPQPADDVLSFAY